MLEFIGVVFEAGMTTQIREESTEKKIDEEGPHPSFFSERLLLYAGLGNAGDGAGGLVSLFISPKYISFPEGIK